jgi:two-component system cell cycle response regulator
MLENHLKKTPSMSSESPALPLSPIVVPSEKLRVLIADDSRIVRATLVKHIQGIFDCREASDGLEAWETLLIDPNIRIVISDLTMPRLDGYGLLSRIRSSKISRIKFIPVVVVSGAEELVDHERARTAGATDLIGKGMPADQLRARLVILSRLIAVQSAFEQGLEAAVKRNYGGYRIDLAKVATLQAHAQSMLEQAIDTARNVVIMTIKVGLQHTALTAYRAPAPESVIDAVGQLLARAMRHSDCVAQTGPAEFTLVTNNVQFAAMRGFGQRLCGAISNAHVLRDEHMIFVASAGLVSTQEDAFAPDLGTMREVAARRALAGFNRAYSGMVGLDEEKSFST